MADQPLTARYIRRIYVEPNFDQTAGYLDVWTVTNHTRQPWAFTVQSSLRDDRGIIRESWDWDLNTFCTTETAPWSIESLVRLWSGFFMIPPGETIIIQDIVKETVLDADLVPDIEIEAKSSCSLAYHFGLKYNPDVQVEQIMRIENEPRVPEIQKIVLTLTSDELSSLTDAEIKARYEGTEECPTVENVNRDYGLIECELPVTVSESSYEEYERYSVILRNESKRLSIAILYANLYSADGSPLVGYSYPLFRIESISGYSARERYMPGGERYEDSIYLLKEFFRNIDQGDIRFVVLGLTVEGPASSPIEP